MIYHRSKIKDTRLKIKISMDMSNIYNDTFILILIHFGRWISMLDFIE